MTAKPRENTNVFREMGTSQCPTISKHTSDYLPTSPTILGDALYINMRIFQVISFKKRNAPAIHYETTAFIYTTSLNPSFFFWRVVLFQTRRVLTPLSAAETIVSRGSSNLDATMASHHLTAKGI